MRVRPEQSQLRRPLAKAAVETRRGPDPGAGDRHVDGRRPAVPGGRGPAIRPWLLCGRRVVVLAEVEVVEVGVGAVRVEVDA
jgi:hypothetical protein